MVGDAWANDGIFDEPDLTIGDIGGVEVKLYLDVSVYLIVVQI